MYTYDKYGYEHEVRLDPFEEAVIKKARGIMRKRGWGGWRNFQYVVKYMGSSMGWDSKSMTDKPCNDIGQVTVVRSNGSVVAELYPVVVPRPDDEE